MIDDVVIGFCATLADGEGFTDMEMFGISKQEWFKTFLVKVDEKSKHSMRLKVKKAGWNNDYLLALLGINPA